MKKRMSLEEIKNAELKILIQFAAFCDRMGLRYYLCGGTLLGAVRHQGFIPWDDDIDILMPRPDFDRLLNMEDSIIPCIELRSWKNGKSPYPFIKAVDVGTEVEETYLDAKHVTGIWIDIFAIDGNPGNDDKNRKLYKKSLFLRGLLKMQIGKAGTGTTRMRMAIKMIMRPLTLLIGSQRLCQCIDEISKTYDFDSCEYIGGVMWGYGPHERLDKEGFLRPIQLEFEGHLFTVPSNYDRYLRNLYGEYMLLPPVEEQKGHEFVAWRMD